MNKLIISALLIFGLVGVIGAAAATPQATTVLGLVVDASDNKVAGAVVNVYSGTSCSGTSLGTFESGSGGTQGFYSIYAGELEPDEVITVCAVHPTAGSGSITTTAGSTVSSGVDVAVNNIPIPEFPTFALPIAAILGLMFIISSRKKKE